MQQQLILGIPLEFNEDAALLPEKDVCVPDKARDYAVPQDLTVGSGLCFNDQIGNWRWREIPQFDPTKLDIGSRGNLRESLG